MIESHCLEQPTSRELVFSLGQILPEGEVDALLQRTQRDLELDRAKVDELDSIELLSVAEQLTRQRGLVSIIARSFAIRLNSYAALAQGVQRD